MSEGDLSRKIIKWIEAQGGCATKVWQGAHSSGDPDILGVLDGRSIALEIKLPDGRHKASALQLHKLKRWKAAGAVAIVATSVQDVANAIEESVG